MLELITKNKDALTRLCQQYGVRRLHLFGSAANGDFTEKSSDLDFLVEFLPCSPSEHYERYFGLVETLENLFGKPVDLVEAGTLRNPYFIQQAKQDRKLLYVA